MNRERLLSYVAVAALAAASTYIGIKLAGGDASEGGSPGRDATAEATPAPGFSDQIKEQSTLTDSIELALQEGVFDSALAFIESALASIPTNDDTAQLRLCRTKLLEGVVLQLKRDYDEAASVFREIASGKHMGSICDSSFMIQAQVGQVVSLARAGKDKASDAALSELDKITKTKWRENVLYMRGMVFYEIGDYESSRYTMQQVLSLDPAHVGAQVYIERLRRYLSG